MANVITVPFGTHINTTETDVKYHITSDLHLFHGKIIQYNNSTRPFKDVDDMNKTIIEHWNKTVGEDDVVFHLGDFSFGNPNKTKEILDQLNGNVVFVRGNHDYKLFARMGVTNAVDLLELIVDGVRVVMCHFPVAAWHGQGRGSVHLHGHSHSMYNGIGRCLDVGWDSVGKIIPLRKAIDICLAKEVECADGHKVIKGDTP